MKKKHIYYSLAAAVLLIGGGVLAFDRRSVSPYASAAASRADLAATVRVSGKVKAADEVDLAFERAGKVSYAPVRDGQAVKRGQLLVSLDNGDYVADMKQAAAALASAQIALEKMQQPADSLAVLEAQDAVSQAIDAKAKADDDIVKTNDSNASAVADTYLDLQTIISGLKDILHASDFNANQDNIDFYADTAKVYDPSADAYRDAAQNAYLAAAGSFAKSSDLAATYDMTKTASGAVKAAGNLIDLYIGKLVEKQISVPAMASAQRAQLSTFAALADGHFAALNAGSRAAKSAQDAAAAASRALSEEQEALRKLQAGAEAIDIRAAQARVDQAQAAYDKTRSAVGKTVLTAPFDGVVAHMDLAAGEMIGANAPAVSVISSAKYEIDAAVSEADIAAVAVGAKAKVTLDTFGSGDVFDATVVSVDPAVTLEKGVGTYGIKLQFAKEDERVKSGMTANIEIVTAERPGVLSVPGSAIITRGADKFVLLDAGAAKPEEHQVQTGITGANGLVEIISGLKEGDKVISFGSN